MNRLLAIAWLGLLVLLAVSILDTGLPLAL